MVVEKDPSLQDTIAHPIGSRQLTQTQIIHPFSTFDCGSWGTLNPALQFEAGAEPLASLRLDDHQQGHTLSFGPMLPLQIRL